MERRELLTLNCIAAIATKPSRTRWALPAPVTELTYAEYTSSSVEDCHRAPARRFSISMSGSFDVVAWSRGQA
jgi:hypothetical protein